MIEAWNDLCLSLSLSNFPFDDAPSASIERKRRGRMDVVESERKKNGFSRSYSDAVAAMRMCVGCKCGGGERKWLAHGLAGSVISETSHTSRVSAPFNSRNRNTPVFKQWGAAPGPGADRIYRALFSSNIGEVLDI